jgi:hypothetical protein
MKRKERNGFGARRTITSKNQLLIPYVPPYNKFLRLQTYSLAM